MEVKSGSSAGVESLGSILVTGGTGFIGSALVRRLVAGGAKRVRVFDNNLRGSVKRLESCLDKIDYIEGDVTDYSQVLKASSGVDSVFHLAFINGTDNFYKIPGKVLEVGVKGAINTLDAALECGVKNYIVTSSSEVYQEPTHVPTTEAERIIIPDVSNPRFSYSGGKIITELLAIHYPGKGRLRTVIVRPHNFYGPDMGMGHVIPQFIERMKTLSQDGKVKKIDFPIQGSGTETRSFCYIDDAVEGIILAALSGKDRELYHIGTEEEISIEYLCETVAGLMGIDVTIIKGELLSGGTPRRCPSIKKASAIGYKPEVSLKDGIKKTIEWYTNEDNLKETDIKHGAEVLR